MRQQRAKSRIPEWTKTPDSEVKSMNAPFAEPIDEMWQWRKDTNIFPIQIHYLGEKCFGEAIHLTIKKVDILDVLSKGKFEAMVNSQEPTYSEKLKIIQKFTDQNTTITMEVFPRQKNVVDHANLYHIWTGQKKKFPFGLREATELPEGKEWESEQVGDLSIEYMLRITRTNMGKVVYLYLRRKDGQELRWKEKQLLKNELQSEELMAIELITKHGEGKPTCLLFPPLGFGLDFGLHII